MSTQPVVALLAGEASSDNLGAPLLHHLRQFLPDARFVGIGGPQMIEAGLESWVDIDELSVNGFTEPVKRLPELFRILISTRDRIVEMNPMCFVGIDFNFFNLLLAGMLKKRGIKTVHYVSPTVWAWRRGRIRSIAKKIDLMLTLYPFELAIYEANGIKAEFVGHPKADEIDPDDAPAETGRAREALGLSTTDTAIAILPGSRGSEVSYSGPDFFAAATIIARAIPGVKFLVPAANEKRRAQISNMLTGFPDLDVNLSVGDSRGVMQAANLVMVNSGTATLEAMLLKKPMVMSYRLGAITYSIVSRLVTTDFFALPNILAGRMLVPEFIQQAATPQNLSDAVLKLLSSDHTELLRDFDTIHRSLKKDSAATAARAILNLVEVTHVQA